MSPATATESPTGIALENVLYEKKGAVAYVTLNRDRAINVFHEQLVGAHQIELIALLEYGSSRFRQ